MKFKRLADLSKDKAEIVAAIKKSKAGLIAVSEDASKIRRSYYSSSRKHRRVEEAS